MTKIGQIKMLIEESYGHFIGCTFTKQDGTERKMVFLNGVGAYVKHVDPKGNEKRRLNLSSQGMMTVYDVRRKWYRVINLKTITRLSVKGEVFLYD